eukprot:2027406-Rhodomonas_salina.1
MTSEGGWLIKMTSEGGWLITRRKVLLGAGIATLAACSASSAAHLRALLTVFVLIRFAMVTSPPDATWRQA